MEEALYEVASLRAFARLSLNEPIPDETTILNFRHLLEVNDLAEDILKAVNALLSRKGLLLKRGSIVDAASVRAKVEHPFRVVKRQFGLVKVSFRGLAKNTAHVVTLFALSNLWMVRKQLMALTGVVRPKTA
jgi:IS5 family transposase